MAESKRCQKCGIWASHDVRYEPPAQYQHNGPAVPERLRYTCTNCGFSHTRPCDDAPSSTPEAR